MKEHPILFSTEMVRAILDGRKTQTRRIIKNPQKLEGLMLNGEASQWCPYGIIGDTLWVREAWWDLGFWDKGEWYGRTPSHKIGPAYVTEGEPEGQIAKSKRSYLMCKWRKRPSIHMPRWVARIFLEITNIRVERVQDIDAVEAEAEGMRRPKRLCPDRHDEYILERFQRLWDSLNAKGGYGWDKNPWVWVIEFLKPPR